MKSLKKVRLELTERFLARLVKKLSHGETSLLVFESGESYPDYLSVIYINQYRDKEQFTQELVARLDSPKIGIGDISGNAIYFTGKELSVLNEIISIALLSGKIEFGENAESVHKKVTQEIRKRSVEDEAH